MIYVAEREDLPTIIEMVLKIPDEIGFEKLPTKNPQKVTQWIYDNWLEAPIFVYKVDSEIVGLVGVLIDSMWWSDERVVQDYVFYIDKDHRKASVFNELIKAVRDFAKLNGLPVVTQFLSAARTETKQKIFERNGFKNAGFIVTYGI